MKNKGNELRIDFKNDKAVLLILPPADYFTHLENVVKQLVNNDYVGIYVSFQRPFENLDFLLKDFGIDTKKLFFIDTTPFLHEQHPVKHPRCVHLKQKINIPKMKKIILAFLHKNKRKKKFVFIDSLSILEEYTSFSKTTDFCHFLISKVRKAEEEEEEEEEEAIIILNTTIKSFERLKKELAGKIDSIIEVP